MHLKVVCDPPLKQKMDIPVLNSILCKTGNLFVLANIFFAASVQTSEESFYFPNNFQVLIIDGQTTYASGKPHLEKGNLRNLPGARSGYSGSLPVQLSIGPWNWGGLSPEEEERQDASSM